MKDDSNFSVSLSVRRFRVLPNNEIEYLTGYIQDCIVSDMSDEILKHVAEKLALDFHPELKFNCDQK